MSESDNSQDSFTPSSMSASSSLIPLINHVQTLRNKHSKAKDKLTASESIQTVLKDYGESEVHRELDRNSAHANSNNLTTWNSLFVQIEAFFTAETGNKKVTEPRKQFLFSLVQLVVRQANRGVHPHLDKTKVFSFLKEKFNDKSCVSSLAFGLLNMLNEFLLVKHYTSTLESSAWPDIISIILKLYRTQNHSVSKEFIVETLNKVIVFSSDYPTLLPVLRNEVVKFFSSNLENVQSSLSTKTKLIHGTILLCRHNAVEFRNVLCNLGENIILSILANSVVTITLDEDKAALVELLMVQVKLHNPCDVGFNSPAFHASNIPKWISIIQSIYSFCYDSIEYIARRSATGYQQNITLPPELLLLAIKVTKHVSDNSWKSDDTSSQGPSSKRPMDFRTFQSIVADVVRFTSSESQLIWIQYIKGVLDSFPESIEGAQTFSTLFQMGMSLLNSNLVVRDEIYSYFLSLLQYESYMINHEIIQERSQSWIIVWDITVKSIRANESKPQALELLLHIMIHVQPKNISSLLQLFVHGSLRLSKSSLRLLAEYLASCSVPQTMKEIRFTSNIVVGAESNETVITCPRQAIINWLLSSKLDYGVGEEVQIANILCSLLIKRSHLLIQQVLMNENVLRKTASVVHEEFERLLLKSSFVTLNENPEPIHRKTSCKIDDRGIFVVQQEVATFLVNLLQEEGLSTTQVGRNAEEVMKKLALVQSRVGLLLNIINLLEKYGIIASDEFGIWLRTKFEELFINAITQYGISVAEFVKANAHSLDHIYSLVQMMRLLLKTDNFCQNAREFFADHYPQQLLELLKKIFRSGLVKYFTNKRAMVMPYAQDASGKKDAFAFVNEVKYLERSSLEALKCLMGFGLAYNDKTRFYSEILDDLFEEGFSNHLFQFELCFELVRSMVPVLRTEKILYTRLYQLLQQMCKSYYTNSDCVAKLWGLFADLTPTVAMEPEDLGIEKPKRKLMSLVGPLCSYLLESGVKVCNSAFKMLSVLAKSDPLLNWSWHLLANKQDYGRVLLDLSQHLQNPSHQIRMLAAGTISEVFQSSISLSNGFEIELVKESLEWRRKLYSTFHESLLNVFDVPDRIPDDALPDERSNRTSLILWSLTKIMFAYPFEQRKVLFCIFLVVRLKQIDVSLANKALTNSNPLVVKTMISHISYALEKWIKMNYEIDMFPFQFFGCNSIAEFHLKFVKEITIQYFEQNKIESLNAFAGTMKKSAQQLVTDCYGTIMGRLSPALALLMKNRDSYIVLPKHISQGNDGHKRLITILDGKDKVESLMLSCLGEVVLNVISLAYNPNITEIWGCPEIRLSEPEPPFYDETSIQIGLDFLKESSAHHEVSIVGYLVQTSQKSIYKILLCLVQRIHNAHDQLDKFWRLHHYSYFVSLLLSEPKVVFDHMKVFLCQFIIHSYLRFLVTENDTKFLASILYLLLSCSKKLVEKCEEEMLIQFRFIIGRVVTAVTKFPELRQTVKEVLHFFFKSAGGTFGDAMVSLDPFPDEESSDKIFDEYKQLYAEKKYGTNSQVWSLSKELQTCLLGVDVSKDTCTKEKLTFLKELLGNRKLELQVLVKELEEKRFLEECKDNVLHNTLRLLVGTTMHADEDEIIFEACRCLGEIGSIDLSVLVLPPFGRKSKITSMITAVPSIIETIASYLTSEDFETTVVTGEVLQSLMEVTECAVTVNKELKSKNERLFSVLIPFMSVHPTAKSTGKVNPALLETKLELNGSNESIEYSAWAIQLACTLIESIQPKGLASRLVPLCKRKVEFCEDILPFLVFNVLYSGRSNSTIRNLITSYFQQFLNHFIAQHQDLVHPSASPNQSLSCGKFSNSVYQNKQALRCILRIVQFLREHTAPIELEEDKPLTAWDNNFWLDLNYLHLAKAAQYCGAYLTSILYGEIYAFRCKDADSTLGENDEFYSQETTSYPQSRNQAEQIEKLMLRAFSNIGEQDAIYGCGYSRLYDFQSNIQYLQQMKKWDRSLSMYDAQASSVSSHFGICQSLKELGLYETLWTYMQGIEHSHANDYDTDLTEIQFECGWRLSRWELNSSNAAYVQSLIPNKNQSSSTSRHKFLFESIQNGLSGDLFSHCDSLRRGYETVARNLRQASLESSVNLYGFLSGFQCLRTIEDYFIQNKTPNSITDLTKKWKVQDQIGFSDFKFEEPVLYLRSTLLNVFRDKHPSRTIDIVYDNSIHQLVTRTRDAGRIELSEKYSTKFLESVDKTRKQVEIARNHRARGDQDLGCHLLKRLVLKTNPEEYQPYPSLLLLYGEWLFETKSERPAVIFDKYLMRACQMYDKKKTTTHSQLEDIAKAHLTLAKYADIQYQNVSNYVKSDMFNEKAHQLQKAKVEQSIADAAKKEKDSHEDIKKSENILRKQSHLDQTEMNTTYLEKKRFLLVALRHYLRGLSFCNDHDLLIFRAIGLWLERADIVTDDVAKEANRIMVEASLPSYKYIMVLHQLSARMGVNNAGINTTINSILMKCAADHPYHTLPVLLTQAFLHKDKEIRGGSQKKQAEVHSQDRVIAAQTLLSTLKNEKKLQTLIQKMELLWLALIELANLKELSNVDNVKKPMRDDMRLKRLTNIETVPVPTTVVRICQSPLKQQQYPTEIIGIQSFDPSYQLVGGMNSPRRICCKGTNGRTYIMLLKGHDDLRQDALMQQVFGVMNKLLKLEPRTKIRRLQIRTYKVVPLSQRSGILEWCENTQTFGDYLVGSKKDTGAHHTYRPKDFKPAECRKKMNEVKDCGDNAKKLNAFTNIVEHFQPVFRHFFFENFKDAGTYFERRLAYTRSVATSSMVGYILGLGDRHVLNILVDKNTGEFIHIDLGVAFEQGRILPIPEAIPFRLTRDVVDGMGVAGVEGVFRRSAEMTLAVLRNNSEIILTILEVLLYDPLYIWTLTADRMQKVQPTDSNKAKRVSVSLTESDTTIPKERNNSAARVLLRLKQKLLGIEEGGTSGSSLSVPGHVSLLIQKAADPDLLSRIFPGWQPYL